VSDPDRDRHDWPKPEMPGAAKERLDAGMPNPWHSEYSHLRANRAGGGMHRFNAPPASYFQNTEHCALEEEFDKYVRQPQDPGGSSRELRTKHTAYFDSNGNTRYMRTKAYVPGANGTLVKALDHVMDASRGPMEKPAATMLKQAVSDALRDPPSSGLPIKGGKGIDPASKGTLERVTYPPKRSSGNYIDPQRTGHSSFGSCAK
jgi:hypothetical protein